MDAKEIVDSLSDADLVFAVYPDGEETPLLGKEVLNRIVESGQAENVRVVKVPVRTVMEAEMIAAAIVLIQKGEMGRKQIDTFQKMLDHARSLN